MRFGIVGAGAIGTLFAGVLAEAGHSVMLIVRRSEVVELIRKKGIRIEGIDERRNIQVQPTTGPGALGNCDIVMIAVKSYDTATAINQIKPYLDRKTTILTLQNGLGNIESIREALPEFQIVGGSTTIGATLLETGRVFWADKGTTIVGESRGPPTSLTRRLAKTLSASGIPTRVTTDLETTLWTKSLVNAGINPVTAVFRIANGELAANRQARIMASQAVREGEEVAEAEGIELPKYPVRMMLRVARKTGMNHSSMLQDVESRRRTEIDAINGAIVRLGRKHGIRTPTNRQLWRAISSLESRFQQRETIKVAA